MLTEISQTQKDKNDVIPFIWGTKNNQIHRDRKQISNDQELREGENEELLLTG